MGWILKNNAQASLTPWKLTSYIQGGQSKTWPLCWGDVFCPLCTYCMCTYRYQNNIKSRDRLDSGVRMRQYQFPLDFGRIVHDLIMVPSISINNLFVSTWNMAQSFATSSVTDLVISGWINGENKAAFVLSPAVTVDVLQETRRAVQTVLC